MTYGLTEFEICILWTLISLKCRANGKKMWLGYFDNEIDAARAYDEAARKYHKEFAQLNFAG